tara:strand:- start:464 stop:808 length:345 start_codon:yes stop_codon:yes gene_type:complete
MLPDPRALKPVGARVIIEIEGRPGVSKGGIELPKELNVEKVKPKAGRIIAAGPGKQTSKALIPMPVAVGDRVIFDAFLREQGNPLATVDGTEYCLANAFDLIAIVDDEVDVTLF